jgi:hypothetical protein
MSTEKHSRERYLGDGVYLSFDGWQICLRAPRNGGDHLVFIEPSMWKRLDAYAREVWPVLFEKAPDLE